MKECVWIIFPLFLHASCKYSFFVCLDTGGGSFFAPLKTNFNQSNVTIREEPDDTLQALDDIQFADISVFGSTETRPKSFLRRSDELSQIANQSLTSGGRSADDQEEIERLNQVIMLKQTEHTEEVYHVILLN